MRTFNGARFALIGASAALASLFSAAARNKLMLAKESELLEQPLGTLVEVDGHRMCVYSQGEGERTLVFLSGSGTISPILDFKGLYSLLSDEFKIVVIEKFGYGFSDIVDTERSFETILRQDKEALSKLSLEGPYVLCPHSMSGLEALLWAQKYPHEVEAIVGLDMALPTSYADFDFAGPQRLAQAAALAKLTGAIRLVYNDATAPKGLSSDEKRIYRALASRIAINKTIVNEGRAVPEACASISAADKPQLPLLLFTSNGREVHAKNWVELQHRYADDLPNATVIELNCGHYVHHHEPKRIAEELRAFLETITH